MSADWNIADTGPNAVAGFLSNARVRSVKWTSPPNASVISGGSVGVGLGVADGALDGESVTGGVGVDGSPEQALDQQDHADRGEHEGTASGHARQRTVFRRTKRTGDAADDQDGAEARPVQSCSAA